MFSQGRLGVKSMGKKNRLFKDGKTIIHCTNCAHILYVFFNDQNEARVDCPLCGTDYRMKDCKTRVNMDVYPKDNVCA